MESFAREVVEFINAYTEYEAAVTVKEMPNGVQKFQVTIGHPDERIRPSINIEAVNGIHNVEQAASQIIDIYKETRKEVPDMSFFTDWEKVKEKLVVRLMPGSFNVPVYRSAKKYGFDDLILVPYVDVNNLFSDGNGGSVRVNNDHIKTWGVTKTDVFEAAIKNTKANVSVESMASFMDKVCPGMFEEGALAGPVIVSNKEKAYGAAGIIGAIGKFKRNNKDGFYVIPSSIHEVLVLPKDGNRTKDEFDTMVREVNAIELAPEEILSDHAYEF